VRTRIPSNATLVQIKDRSEDAAKASYEQLCNDVTRLCNSLLLTRSEEARKLQVEAMKDALKKVFGGFFSMLVFALSSTEQEAARQAMLAVRLTINSTTEANLFLLDMLKPILTDADRPIAAAIRYKIAQMEQYEKRFSADAKKDVLSTVEPGAIFAQTYVMSFPRASLNTLKYNLSFDVNHRKEIERRRLLPQQTQSIPLWR
jgi:hypothetical protein